VTDSQQPVVINSRMAERIRADTGENVYLCYQCVKCTSGCPMVEFFDYTPNQIMRAAQLGQTDILFNALTPWLCASCLTCTTRCPQGIDVARVMEYITQAAREEGYPPKVSEIALFNKVFLRDVNIFGRMYEMGLMVEMNVRTGNPFKDVFDMGLGMIRRGKIPFVPHIARHPRQVQRREPAENEVMLYPGCSFHATGVDFGLSTEAVLEALGLKMIEPTGWTCCGASSAHKTDHHLGIKLPLENLATIEQMGYEDVTVPCAACYNRFKAAAYEVGHAPALHEELSRETGYAYQNNVDIRSVLEMLLERVGEEEIHRRVKRPLEGLRVVPYYGCLLTRPPEVTGSPHPENPTEMDRILRALGAEVVDWSDKTRCCGGSLSLTRTDIALKLSRDLIDHARAAGADAMALACPLCHANVDARQIQMDIDEPMPMLYITQLMAIAFGLSERAAALNKNMIDPRPLLREKGLLG
jgi:heterodisulfide reductase subunit B